MSVNTTIYLTKAEESLAGAESEFANGRYNNCANRSYYACFQAAITALDRTGIAPSGGAWGHAFVQAQFVGHLINRRHLYPTELRDTLAQTLTVRVQADYKLAPVSQAQAARTVARARLRRRCRTTARRNPMTHAPDLHDPRVQARLLELQATIARAYPAATFAVAHGEDPEGIYLTATVDVEDLDEVTALVLDRLIEIQVDEELPLYMVPDQPPARVLARLREEAARPVAALLPAV